MIELKYPDGVTADHKVKLIDCGVRLAQAFTLMLIVWPNIFAVKWAFGEESAIKFARDIWGGLGDVLIGVGSAFK